MSYDTTSSKMNSNSSWIHHQLYRRILLIVQWIAALIAEICFITCVMLQQKIKQFLHDFSSFIESQDRT